MNHGGRRTDWTALLARGCQFTFAWGWVLGGIAASAAFADAPLEGTQPAQWRLVWSTEPATEAIVSWSTAKPGANHAVHYDDKPAEGGPDGYGRKQVAQTNGKYSPGAKGDPELYYHHAHLSGLEPDTTYHLTIVSDGQASPPLHFRTAPVNDKPVRVLFGGDSRSDRQARRQVNTMIAEMVRADPSIVALAHGGDYIATGTNLAQWSEWMSDHELTVADGRLLPIVPARGNHDRGPLFNEIFGFEPDDRNFYGVCIGPEIRLITLNTETKAAGEQRDWLEKELSTWRPQARWLVAQYHQPAFAAVKFPSAAMIYWVPLFEQYDLDLACEADGHAIKRTVPIRNKKLDPTGVVYIGEGGMGVRQRSPRKGLWYLQPPGMAGAGHHMHLLSFDDQSLAIEARLLSGETIDRFRRPARQVAVESR